jgi:sulfofructose kinase
VATRGAAGAVAAHAGDGPDGDRARRIDISPRQVDVISTLGAGDVFHGALLAGLVEGRDLAAALERAALCAALACRGLDGRSAIPTARELDAAWAAKDEVINAVP